MTATRYSPHSEVVVGVCGSGAMMLSLGAQETRYPPEATAVWIALRQYGGRSEDAAACLAAAWEETPEDVHAEILALVEQWRQKGYLLGEA